MIRRGRALAPAGVMLLGALACGSRDVRRPSAVALGGDPARVGDLAIPASVVADLARSRAEGARPALDALVEDALLAGAARAAGLEATPAVGWASTTALARIVPERLRDEARARGGPTDDEIATVRVVHAVVRRPSSMPSGRLGAIADAIAQAVAGARDDDDFEKRATQVPHVGAQVVVERLPAFDLAGHTTDGAEIDPVFVAAAFALHSRGELSPVVETGFGWHVIRLIDREPPDPQAVERLRRDLAGAAEGARVRAELGAVLREQRSRKSVEISPGAAALMTEAAASVP